MTLEQPLRMRRFENRESLTDALAGLLRETMEVERDAPFAVMLAGGATPLPAYTRLCSPPFKPATGLHLFFSDERHVPADSNQSNYGAVRPTIRSLGLPDAKVIRVRTELPLEAAARDYDARLAGFHNRGGVFALGLLGLGADGHTASLFTMADINRAERGLAVAIPRPQPPDRVSVTPALLQMLQRVIVVVSGEDKREISETLLKSPHLIPAGCALANCESVELWQAP